MPFVRTQRSDGTDVAAYIPPGSTREDIDRALDGPAPTLYRCAGAHCPGLPWRASDRAHPTSCVGDADTCPVAPPDPHPLAVLLRQVADVLEDHDAPATADNVSISTGGYVHVYGPGMFAWVEALPGSRGAERWYGWEETRPWWQRSVTATVAGLCFDAIERSTACAWSKWTTTGPGPLLVVRS